jgi:hypothetical protein
LNIWALGVLRCSLALRCSVRKAQSSAVSVSLEIVGIGSFSVQAPADVIDEMIATCHFVHHRLHLGNPRVVSQATLDNCWSFGWPLQLQLLVVRKYTSSCALAVQCVCHDVVKPYFPHDPWASGQRSASNKLLLVARRWQQRMCWKCCVCLASGWVYRWLIKLIHIFIWIF